MDDAAWERESGQSTSEYVGVLVVVVVLVIGTTTLATPGLGRQVWGAISSAHCSISSRLGAQVSCVSNSGGGDDLTDDVPWYLDPSLTPLEQVTAGDYVALGDSYSSGEGGSRYDPDTNNDHNRCHRSEGAYGQLLAQSYEFAGAFTFAACSGAVTGDLHEENQGEPPQLDHLDENTSLVTLTIGGNDARFADTLAGCIMAGLNPLTQCADSPEERAEIEANIDQALDNLTSVLPDVRAAAPNATIMVVGYPQFFPDDPGSAWSDGTQIDTEDIRYINSAVQRMNAGISDVVGDLNEFTGQPDFRYVDVEDAFEGCHIGDSDPCMNNIDVVWTGGRVDFNGSYHPNDRGHEAIAEIVKEAVHSGP